MSVRSKFERKLAFRELGFSIKIPDVGRSLKPFDYVVGIPLTVYGNKILRFVAIEAKKASGWSMPLSVFRNHQVKALDLVEKFAPMSSWVAIGFLDAPNMKLDWNRRRIEGKLRAEAFLIPWALCKELIKLNGAVTYKSLIEWYREYRMEYGKIGSAYKWFVGDKHPIHYMIVRSNSQQN